MDSVVWCLLLVFSQFMETSMTILWVSHSVHVQWHSSLCSNSNYIIYMVFCKQFFFYFHCFKFLSVIKYKMLGQFVQNVPYSIKIFLSSRDYLNIHEMEYQNPLNISLNPLLLPHEPSLVNFKSESTQTLPVSGGSFRSSRLQVKLDSELQRIDCVGGVPLNKNANKINWWCCNKVTRYHSCRQHMVTVLMS